MTRRSRSRSSATATSGRHRRTATTRTRLRRAPGQPRRSPGPRRARAAAAPTPGSRSRRSQSRTRASIGRPPRWTRPSAAARIATAFEVAAAHGVRGARRLVGGRRRDGGRGDNRSAVVDRVTDAFMKTTCIADDGRSGWANRSGSSLDDIDPQAVAEAAASRASGAFAARREAVKLEPASIRSCSPRQALAEMLDWLAVGAFNGLAHAEGRGALVDRSAVSWSPPPSTSPTRRATRARCRAPSTPRACRNAH